MDGVLRFAVRLTPRGGRDRIEGWMTGADGAKVLKARVSAVPEDGKANRALVALLADALDVARSQVRIVGGQTSRVKIVEVAGDAQALSARLDSVGTVP